MIDADLFDKLVGVHLVTGSVCTLTTHNQEFIARGVREDKRPFGGIQVSRPHQAHRGLCESSSRTGSSYSPETFSNSRRLILVQSACSSLFRRYHGTSALVPSHL